MISNLLAGAATCLLSGYIQFFAVSTLALLIFLFPLRALALVVGLTVTALASAAMFHVISRI